MHKKRKVISLSLDAKLVSEAQTLGISVSRAAEDGIAGAVQVEKERRWLIENADATEAYNTYIRNNGLPLARYCGF